MISSLNKLFCFLVFVNQLFAQDLTKQKINGFNIEFETSKRRLNGNFKAYAVGNNQLFVEGTLLNGQRTGVWTIYDTLNPNKVLIQRSYYSSNRFKQLVPNQQRSELVSFISDNFNLTPEFDSTGCRSYVYVSSNDYIYGKRIFRELTISENPQIPFDQINTMLKEKCSEIGFWKYANEQFSEVLNKNPFENLPGAIVAYRIKEDFFFDKNQMISEYRTLGFAPVYKDDLSGELKELCWFYYPYMRKYFKDIKINQGNNQYHFDDVILEREFSGIVYKTMDTPRIQNQIEKNQFITDIECLMAEHDLWMFFVGYGDL